jgi:hypothetical protein
MFVSYQSAIWPSMLGPWSDALSWIIFITMGASIIGGYYAIYQFIRYALRLRQDPETAPPLAWKAGIGLIVFLACWIISAGFTAIDLWYVR